MYCPMEFARKILFFMLDAIYAIAFENPFGYLGKDEDIHYIDNRITSSGYNPSQSNPMVDEGPEFTVIVGISPVVA